MTITAPDRARAATWPRPGHIPAISPPTTISSHRHELSRFCLGRALRAMPAGMAPAPPPAATAPGMALALQAPSPRRPYPHSTGSDPDAQ